MGSNTEKKPWTNLQKLKQRDCYHKVGRAMNKWGAIEKSSILLYCNIRVTKIISHFGGSNNIFADCRCNYDISKCVCVCVYGSVFLADLKKRPQIPSYFIFHANKLQSGVYKMH